MIDLLTEEKIVVEARGIVKEYLKYQKSGVRVKTVSQAIRNFYPRLYINNPMMIGIINQVIGDEIEQFVAVHPFGVAKSPVQQLRYRSKE